MSVIETPKPTETQADIQTEHDELMRRVDAEFGPSSLDLDTWRKLLELEALARLRKSIDDPAFALRAVREIPGLAKTCGPTAMPYLDRLASPPFDPLVQRQAFVTRAEMALLLRRRTGLAHEVVGDSNAESELVMEGGALVVEPAAAESNSVVIRTATLQWRDGDYAICRFEHPQKEKYGTVEREFRLAELPVGIEDGDSFTVEMEVDETGRPVSYVPLKTSLKKRVRDPSEPVRPELPANLADRAAVAAYIEKLDAFTRAEFEWVKAQP